MYVRLSMLGVNLDIDPVDLPPSVWGEADNMVATPGAMVRARGYQEVFPTPLFDPKFLLHSPQLTEPYWVYGGTQALAVINPFGVHSDITPATLTTPIDQNGWTGGNLNGIAVVNSLENGPYYWFNGVGAEAQPLPNQ